VAVVWGSGIIDRADTFERPLRIHSVRGPITRDRCLSLGYPCPPVYGDPAILLPLLLPPGEESASGVVGVIPHFEDFSIASELLAHSEGIRLIDVTMPVERVVSQIASCEVTVSSSLHGLVVSHAYGKPSCWVEFSDKLQGDSSKFEDHFKSGGIDEKVSPYPLQVPRSADELKQIAVESPLPDLAPLVSPLLRSCPFPMRASLMPRSP
jgi:hypothetical protein